MYIYIDDREFWLDFGCFPEKISRLKKLEQIKFKINRDKNLDKLINEQ